MQVDPAEPREYMSEVNSLAAVEVTMSVRHHSI
jgi:hypothetical protein